MAKWFGKIGFAENVETRPGVHEDKIVTREYYGDLIRNTRRLQTVSNKVNDDVNISNQISIVADPYAQENIYAMRYAEFAGAKWKIETVEVLFPRLILDLGGVYHGDDGE